VTLTGGHALFLTASLAVILTLTKGVLPRMLGTADGRARLGPWRFAVWAAACAAAVYAFRDLAERVGLTARSAIEYFGILAVAVAAAAAASALAGRSLRLRDNRDERLATLAGGAAAILWYYVRSR
jgi:hypothetical protein